MLGPISILPSRHVRYHSITPPVRREARTCHCLPPIVAENYLVCSQMVYTGGAAKTYVIIVRPYHALHIARIDRSICFHNTYSFIGA